MKKSRYLVVHDYGQGGLWAVLTAKSEEEICSKYRDLIVVSFRPFWMTDEIYSNIEATNSFDLDSENVGWLNDLKRLQS